MTRLRDRRARGARREAAECRRVQRQWRDSRGPIKIAVLDAEWLDLDRAIMRSAAYSRFRKQLDAHRAANALRGPSLESILHSYRPEPVPLPWPEPTFPQLPLEEMFVAHPDTIEALRAALSTGGEPYRSYRVVDMPFMERGLIVGVGPGPSRLLKDIQEARELGIDVWKAESARVASEKMRAFQVLLREAAHDV